MLPNSPPLKKSRTDAGSVPEFQQSPLLSRPKRKTPTRDGREATTTEPAASVFTGESSGTPKASAPLARQWAITSSTSDHGWKTSKSRIDILFNTLMEHAVSAAAQGADLPEDLYQALVSESHSLNQTMEQTLEQMFRLAEVQNMADQAKEGFRQVLARHAADKLVHKIQGETSSSREAAETHILAWCERFCEVTTIYPPEKDKVKQREGIAVEILEPFKNEVFKKITRLFVPAKPKPKPLPAQKGAKPSLKIKVDPDSIRFFNQTVDRVSDHFLKLFPLPENIANTTEHITAVLRHRTKAMILQILGGSGDEFIRDIKEGVFKFYNTVVPGTPNDRINDQFHHLLSKIVDTDLPLIKGLLGTRNLLVSDEQLRSFLIAELAAFFASQLDDTYNKKVGGAEFLKFGAIATYEGKKKLMMDCVRKYAGESNAQWLDGALCPPTWDQQTLAEYRDQADTDLASDDTSDRGFSPMETAV